MDNLQIRTMGALQTRDAGGVEENSKPIIEGYFAVFDEVYQIYDDWEERIDPHAFDSSINGDIRALIDHNTAEVLGRTTAATLTLKVDNRGLYGVISVNPNDRGAMDLYARVQRGDVNQCSFGFVINGVLDEYRKDGTILTTITDLTLFEVSVCTFPAYETTEVQARAKDAHDNALKRWRADMLARLKTADDNTKTKENK